jgi:hypothetical protein
MAKDTTPNTKDEATVTGTGEGNAETTVAKPAKAEKKYFVELKRGLDSHAWAVLLPNHDSPSATLIAGTRTEVTKEVYDFISHPDRNKDIYNPQTQETEKLFRLETV